MSDAYEFYRDLEELSQKHARLLRRLGRVMRQLKLEPSNVELQERSLEYLRRLRVIRGRLLRSLRRGLDLEGVDESVVEGIGILSEYMVLAGLELERDVLRGLIRLGRRGATLIQRREEEIRRDLEELEELLDHFSRYSLGGPPPGRRHASSSGEGASE